MLLATKKLILFWDDVFNQLLEEVKLLFQNEMLELLPNLLEQVIFLPLRDSLIAVNNYLFGMMINPYFYLFLHEVVSTVIFGLYLVVLLLLICQLISRFIQSMGLFSMGRAVLPKLMKPLQKMILLHLLQFIGFPLVVNFLEYYPQFIHNLYEFFHEFWQQ